MRRFLVVISMMLAVMTAMAQQPQRSMDPTLNPGQGLTMTPKQLEEMRGDGQNKRTAQKDIWLFGVSFSLIDSVVYVTEVQQLKDMIVSNGWFLYNRAELEGQFQSWLMQETGIAVPMTTLYFHEKQKRMEKKRERVIKRLRKKNGQVFPVPAGKFGFTDQ